MNLNGLYNKALKEGKKAENEFIQFMSERFLMFLLQRSIEKEDAKEIVQEALITIVNEYKKIEIRHSFSEWAYKVLINRMQMYFRTTKRRKQAISNLRDRLESIPNWTPDPILAPKLLKCLKKLARGNTRYARVLNLKFQGYTVKEICDKMDLTPNNLYIIVSRARSMLLSFLEQEGIEYE